MNEYCSFVDPTQGGGAPLLRDAFAELTANFGQASASHLSCLVEDGFRVSPRRDLVRASELLTAERIRAWSSRVSWSPGTIACLDVD